MADARPPPLLQVEDLTVEIQTPNGLIRATDALSYEVASGEILGVVGESGSGKTIGALALLGLLPMPNAKVVRGRVILDGRDLLTVSYKELRSARGKDISIIFQDPLTSLNPVFTIERQLMDAVLAHTSISRSKAKLRSHELLRTVGVKDSPRRAGQFPHQWSGGMRQRALIAMALANSPRLIVADEPTTALDVTIQAQVFETLRKAQQDSDAAMILISHDLAQVAETADRVLVMYAGRIVEDGPVDQILAAPRHPYTQGLLDSVPRIGPAQQVLEPIPGSPPSLLDVSQGCAFQPRCTLSDDRQICKDEQPDLLMALSEAHLSACHFRDEAIRTTPNHRAPTALVDPAPGEQQVALEASDLSKEYLLPRAGLRPREKIQAVDNVSITLRRGETLGLVGESGCGKSTLAWILAGLVKPDAGGVVVNGTDITNQSAEQMQSVRRHLQIVFQDPLASLDPRMLVDDILTEPLAIHRVGSATERGLRVSELLDLVGLDQRHSERYPHELSGGQRQRVAIARALALDTKILILDEPVSALDVSIQAQIIRLLQDLQRELGLSLLLISHDLAVVHALSKRVAVMYLGRIVETGTRDEVYQTPRHPYTRALLAAVPRIEGRQRIDPGRLLLSGETPRTHAGNGCSFRDRCWKAQGQCEVSDPVLTLHPGTNHQYACHFPEDAPMASLTTPR